MAGRRAGPPACGQVEFYPKRGRGFWDKFYLVFFFKLVIIGIEWKLVPSDA